jgi:hypothetical protein
VTLTEKSGHMAWCALVALLKEVGEAGQHDDFTEDVGFGVITVAKVMTSRSRQAAYIE